MNAAPWVRFYEEGVPSSIDYPECTLQELFDRTVERFPQRMALRFFLDARLPVPSLTYEQLQEATLRFATALYSYCVTKLACD